MAPSYDIDNIKQRGEANARGVYAFSQRQLDRFVSPSTRQDMYASAKEFAHERPLLFAFILFQLIFSFLPLVIFTTFALSTVAFALGAALIFALFWIGIALLVLVPTLFLTSSVGLLVWLWAAGSFIVAKRLWGLAPSGGQQSVGRSADGEKSSNGGTMSGVVVKEEAKE